MSTVTEIETALSRLPLEDLQAVRDWLDDIIEEQLDVSDEFRSKVERAKKEIGNGVQARVRRPNMGR